MLTAGSVGSPTSTCIYIYILFFFGYIKLCIHVIHYRVIYYNNYYYPGVCAMCNHRVSCFTIRMPLLHEYGILSTRVCVFTNCCTRACVYFGPYRLDAMKTD